jgi:hypothetical protein
VKASIRTLAKLGPEVVLAPERHLVGRGAPGVPLGELVVERTERVEVSALAGHVVVDTTHARDGVLDLGAALAEGPAASAKKRALEGDLLVSRLRPYLRQIALVHPVALAVAGGRPLAVSTELHVLSPAAPGDDLAWLVPFLLGRAAQATLRAAQEGGHHPRVPRVALLSLRVPHALVDARARTSKEVRARLAALYRAERAYRALLEPR